MKTADIRKKYFKGDFEGKIKQWIEVAEGCVVLADDTSMMKFASGREVQLLFIPNGERHEDFSDTSTIELSFEFLTRSTPLRKSMGHRIFVALTKGRFLDYLMLVGDVRSVFGRDANLIVDAIRVPDGVLALLAADDQQSCQLIHVSLSPGNNLANNAIQVVGEPWYPDLATRNCTLFEQAIDFCDVLYSEGCRRQSVHKNVTMHIPSFRFRLDTLQYAIEFGRTDQVEALAAMSADIDYRDWEGNSALHLAAIRGKTTAVTRVLLDAGAKSNFKNRRADTPLDVAIKCDNTAAAAGLLEAEDQIEAINCRGLTVLEACEAASATEVEAVCRALLSAREARKVLRSLGGVLPQSINAM